MNEHPKHILVAEDDALLRDELSHMFAEHGYGVSVAETGTHVLEKAQGANTPDLIILDVMMPEVDGITLLKQLRELPKLKNTPILILSNIGESGTVAEALEAGSYDYMIKSDWKAEDVLAKVKERLG